MMEMNDQVLEILRCPVTGDRLRELSPDEIGRLNILLSRGALSRLDGGRPAGEIRSGLVSLNGRFAYVVEDDVMVLLKKSAIKLDDGKNAGLENHAFHESKKDVQDFYDRVGWTKAEGGKYADTLKFTDPRPFVKEYYARCDKRIKRYLKSEGAFFLDAGSGPIPSRDYLEYSANYDFRICVDLSLLALREAREKLKDKGIYILADLTDLPLCDDLVDGAVSLHVIYHIPSDEQARAFREIHRVLKPGASAVVVYSWGGRSFPMRIMRGMKLLFFKIPRGVIQKVFPGAEKTDGKGPSGEGEPSLYFHAHRYGWFKKQGFNFDFDILCYRSLGEPLLGTFIHRRLFGKQILDLAFYLEDLFPRLAGRLGEYPMIIVRKQG